MAAAIGSQMTGSHRRRRDGSFAQAEQIQTTSKNRRIFSRSGSSTCPGDSGVAKLPALQLPCVSNYDCACSGYTALTCLVGVLSAT